MTHPCPVRRCAVTDVPDSKLMCYPDWARVPEPLKRAVNRAYARQGLEEPGGGDAAGDLADAYDGILSALFWAMRIPEAVR